jgi:hypothetical protein
MGSAAPASLCSARYAELLSPITFRTLSDNPRYGCTNRFQGLHGSSSASELGAKIEGVKFAPRSILPRSGHERPRKVSASIAKRLTGGADRRLKAKRISSKHVMEKLQPLGIGYL